jgi:hypothetical protein
MNVNTNDILMHHKRHFCTIRFPNNIDSTKFYGENRQFVEVGALNRKLKELQAQFPKDKPNILAQKAICQLVLE